MVNSKDFFTALSILIVISSSSALRACEEEDGAEDRGRATNEIDFDTQVIPVLTKTGCNAAACHGAAAGRGGFYLSLFGSNPTHDYEQIVRALKGRRVNVADPDSSLILRKPTGDINHEGGLRFELESREHEILRNWISAGAPRQQPRIVEAIRVTFAGVRRPIAIPVTRLPALLKPQVEVKFSDGEVRDVTEWSSIAVDDTEKLSIGDDDSITVHRAGRAHVFISFLNQIEVIPITIAQNTKVDIEKSYREVNAVDRSVNAMLRQLGIPAESRADDATLLRRVTLSLTGELPSAEQVQAFLSDTRLDKYKRYVEQLIDSPEFDRYQAFRLSNSMRVTAPPQEPEVAMAIRRWLEDGFRNQRRWDVMVREMITATGDTHQSGAAAIHRISSDPRSEAEYMSEVVLGIRLRCANCHDHPLDRWTQDDYHGLAAIFARVSRGRQLRERSQGSVIHPGTGEVALRRLPGDRILNDNESGRTAFADWVLAEPNRLMARVTVNRLWHSMMGQGLVEPVDDLRASNPPTHPELLDYLTEKFVSEEFRIAPILHEIALSDTFQRKTCEDNSLAARYHAAYLAHPMEPAILLDTISQVTGNVDNALVTTESKRARDQADPYFRSPELEALGRCPRGEECGNATNGDSMTLPTALHLINGQLLNSRIEDNESSLAKLIESNSSNEEIIRHFYHVGLSRTPTTEEFAFWSEELRQAIGDGQPRAGTNRRQRLQDFVWALLNSREFRTIH